MSNKHMINIPPSVVTALIQVLTEQPDELVDRLSVFLYSKADVSEGRLLQNFLLEEISKYKSDTSKTKVVDGFTICYVVEEGDIEVLNVNNVSASYISQGYLTFLESELNHMLLDDMADEIAQEADFRYSQMKEES